MEDLDLIRRTEEFLKQSFDNSAYLTAHPKAKDYRLEHSYRVASIGRQIAREEGLGERDMVIACLLHDISYCEDFGENGWIEHGRRAAQIARPFLKELGLPAERIDDICYGIAIHVDDAADFPGERTNFALTIGDADNIDRFDAYRIHETLSRDGFLDMTHAEKREYLEKRLRKIADFKDLPLATKTAQMLWDERLSFYGAFLEKLLLQLKAGKGL